MIAGRLLVVAVIAGALIAVRLMLLWRSRRYRRRGAADLLASASGHPLILAFSTPDCVPCRTIQKPALEELLRRYPDRVAVRDVDAVTEPALSRRFGILTVPSTVVIDGDGAVVAINHTPARWEQLAGQLHLNGAGAVVTSGEEDATRS